MADTSWADEQIGRFDGEMKEASGRVKQDRKYGGSGGWDNPNQMAVQTAAVNANRWRRVRDEQRSGRIGRRPSR